MDTVTNAEMGPLLQLLLNLVVSGLVSGAVLAAIMGFLLKRRTEEIAARVRNEFELALQRERSKLEWEKEALARLFGPMVMQLDRTRRAFRRYTANNLYLEARVLKAGNETIRDLLLANGHLVPHDLRDDAQALIEHYDRWLEEYERLRGGAEPRLEEPFVFVGTKGSPFPTESEKRFVARFEQLLQALYGGKG